MEILIAWPFSTGLFSSAPGIFWEIFGPSGIEIIELEKKKKPFGWILGDKVRQGCVCVFFLRFGRFCSPFNSKFNESQEKCSLRKYSPLNLTRRSIALFSWALIGWCGVSCFCCDSIWVGNLYQKNTPPLKHFKIFNAKQYITDNDTNSS